MPAHSLLGGSLDHLGDGDRRARIREELSLERWLRWWLSSTFVAFLDCWGKTRVKQASILLLTTVGLLCWGHCAEATQLIYRFGRQVRALARTASRRTDAIKRSARRHLGALFLAIEGKAILIQRWVVPRADTWRRTSERDAA